MTPKLLNGSVCNIYIFPSMFLFISVDQEYAKLQVTEPKVREGMEQVEQPNDDLFPCSCHRTPQVSIKTQANLSITAYREENGGRNVCTRDCILALIPLQSTLNCEMLTYGSISNNAELKINTEIGAQ